MSRRPQPLDYSLAIARATHRVDRRYAALRRGGGDEHWERYVESLDLLLRLQVKARQA